MKRLSFFLGIFAVSIMSFAQKFESHKVYLPSSSKTSSVIIVNPTSDYSIKKDSQTSWVNYEIRKDKVTITALENRTNKERYCEFLLLDKLGTPLDTLQVIQSAASTTRVASTVGTVSRTTSTYNSKSSKKTSTSTYGGQCAATTKKGTRYTRTASAGSRYCWQHNK